MIWHIARREWVEQARQPAMLASIGALFLAIAAVTCTGLDVLDRMAASSSMVAELVRWGVINGESGVDPLVATVVSVANWLEFTQYLGITAVLAGHAMLHDRERGTLPFLLLAPVGRGELLAGKVLGALGPAYVVYVLTNGLASAFVAWLPVTQVAADRLPPSPAWFVAFFIGAPAWAALVATVCAIVSSLVADVRTAQQIVWLVMFFATFVCGFLLSALLPQGLAVQLVVAALGAGSAAVALWAGSQLMRRDLGR